MLHPNGVFNLLGEGVAKKGRTQVWSKQLRFGSNWMKSFWSCSVIYCRWNIRTHWDLDDRHVWFQPSQRRHRPPSNPERASCFQWQWLAYKHKHTYATEWTSISNTWHSILSVEAFLANSKKGYFPLHWAPNAVALTVRGFLCDHVAHVQPGLKPFLVQVIHFSTM